MRSIASGCNSLPSSSPSPRCTSCDSRTSCLSPRWISSRVEWEPQSTTASVRSEALHCHDSAAVEVLLGGAHCEHDPSLAERSSKIHGDISQHL